jgi:hypothetical protein
MLSYFERGERFKEAQRVAALKLAAEVCPFFKNVSTIYP